MVYIFIFDVFRTEILVCNNVDPDQRSFDLGLHYLSLSQKGTQGLKENGKTL